MSSNKAVIFSAPSGAGKTTLVRYLLAQGLPLEFSISACSRAPRGQEVDGKDYHFLSPQDFKKQIEKGAFLEWEEVYDNMFYGTLQSELERIWTKGNQVVFDIDVLGGINIKNQFGDQALAIFIAPPSLENLKRRLEGRGTETTESLTKRLGKAEEELTHQHAFDIVIVNDDLDTARQEVMEKVSDFLNK